MAGRHQANSRFLTDYYLFPAALLSAHCRKSTRPPSIRAVFSHAKQEARQALQNQYIPIA
jgi:hypothetical protein